VNTYSYRMPHYPYLINGPGVHFTHFLQVNETMLNARDILGRDVGSRVFTRLIQEFQPMRRLHRIWIIDKVLDRSSSKRRGYIHYTTNSEIEPQLIGGFAAVCDLARRFSSVSAQCAATIRVSSEIKHETPTQLTAPSCSSRTRESSAAA